ncbi:MAG: S8 family peptidase [Burkholderiales bacterium]|nr:S8 family peptidase [Burkholderiales bacterium]
MNLSTFAHLLLAVAALAAAAPSAALVADARDAAAAYAPKLIVKFKPGAAGTPAERVARLAADTGITLVQRRMMAIGAQVLTSPEVKSQQDAEAIAGRLAAHPDVAYAERSHRVRAQRVPDDPLFANQLYLAAGAATIDAPGAWDETVGSASIVVAVLDTGSTAHADLAGRLLAGYDFVSSAALSNDGGSADAAGSYRDADASDPGDWVSAADIAANMIFSDNDCTVRDSSWHGMSVMGVIAAATDNGRYLAGVDWRARILPLRVLGKCYGDDPDVADAIAWAAGLPVPGVPINATPAQVINLSLGDPGPCPQFMQDAIAAALANGITRAIVAAGGNANSSEAFFPAVCDGVIAVAASTLAGSRAGYSNFGARIDIAAPGGNGSGASANNILSLTDVGATGPVADGVRARSGTSFAAPLVSGVLSLMLSVAPGLSAADLRQLLVASAKPFPMGSTCTTAICGAGLLDAPGAVIRAKAAAGAAVSVTLVEFYHEMLDHYFITWVTSEIDALDTATTSKGWARTGRTWKALRNGVAGTTGLCRIYIPPDQGDGHYYGRDTGECHVTMATHPDFVVEGSAFFYLYTADAGRCPHGTRPVYRVYSNRADANHRYTTDRAVRDQMVAKRWLAEGDGDDVVVACAPE